MQCSVSSIQCSGHSCFTVVHIGFAPELAILLWFDEFKEKLSGQLYCFLSCWAES